MKREVKIYDVSIVHNKLLGALREEDSVRGWPADSPIFTSSILSIDGDRYETRNTVYIVENLIQLSKGQVEEINQDRHKAT